MTNDRRARYLRHCQGRARRSFQLGKAFQNSCATFRREYAGAAGDPANGDSASTTRQGGPVAERDRDGAGTASSSRKQSSNVRNGALSGPGWFGAALSFPVTRDADHAFCTSGGDQALAGAAAADDSALAGPGKVDLRPRDRGRSSSRFRGCKASTMGADTGGRVTDHSWGAPRAVRAKRDELERTAFIDCAIFLPAIFAVFAPLLTLGLLTKKTHYSHTHRETPSNRRVHWFLTACTKVQFRRAW